MREAVFNKLAGFPVSIVIRAPLHIVPTHQDF
jgi:hypothetical protein